MISLISLFFLGQTLSIYSQNEEEDASEDMVPFDAVIQSEMGGKRVKFYGNTKLKILWKELSKKKKQKNKVTKNEKY